MRAATDAICTAPWNDPSVTACGRASSPHRGARWVGARPSLWRALLRAPKSSGWSVAFTRTVGEYLTSPALLAPGVRRVTLPARRNRKHVMFAAACIR